MFRCTKVLPTVFDDSLSYYEAICKLSEAIKELQEVINGGIMDYIKEHLNDLIFKCSYIEENEEIVFAYDVIQTGEDIHIYNSDDKTIYIKNKEWYLYECK